LSAMECKGVHVVTVNDYLAQRDASWMGNLYNFLGLSVGVIINDASYLFDPEYDNAEHEDENMRKLRPATRKEAYAADITYGTTMLGAVITTIFTFLWTGFRSNYLALDFKIVLAIFVIRLVSALFFTGFVSKLLCDQMVKSGVVKVRG